MDIKNLVTENDTEALDAKIESFKQDIVQQHHLDIEGEEFLEYLVAKSMKLGELYERKRWQEAQAQAMPEGFVLVPREPTDAMLQIGNKQLSAYYAYKAMIESAEKEMIAAQEQSHD